MCIIGETVIHESNIQEQNLARQLTKLKHKFAVKNHVLYVTWPTRKTRPNQSKFSSYF